MRNQWLEDLIHPISKDEISVEGEEIKDVNGNKIGSVHEATSTRFDWISSLDYGELDNAILKEINKYDSWAEKKLGQTQEYPEVIELKDFQLFEEDIYKFSELRLVTDLPQLLQGAKVLDIGGSCMDAWRFLAAGVDKLHQLEVSSQSQEVGRDRIASKLGHKVLENVCFHTAAAEYMPFKDNTFDIVFSRSTIHHTKRNFSVAETYRVLKPGGKFLMLEPLISHLFKGLTLTARKVRNIDRGSDDPLTNTDLQIMKKAGFDIKHSPKNVFLNSFKAAAKWVKLYKNQADNSRLIYCEK